MSIRENFIKCIRLYDKNGIKVNIEPHITSNQLEQFSLNNIFNNTYIHSREESEKLMQDYRDDANSILKIYYELLDTNPNRNQMINYPGEGNPNRIQRMQFPGLDEDLNSEDHGEDGEQSIEEGNVDRSNTILNRMQMHRQRVGSDQKELIPYKIIPESVDINQYNIEIRNNKIVDVRNKETGLVVFFEAVLIKEDTGNKIKGLISTSSLKVYTAMYNKDIINIIHMHLNDTSEEIAVDSVFLEKGQQVNDYKKFATDYLGKKLNYKLLFRDYKLVKIFYNLSEEFTDEPQFEEIRLMPEKIVKIKNHELYKDCYGKVFNIPVGMLARKVKDNFDLERGKSSDAKKEGYCSERHLEELPGFVDLTIMFTPEMKLMDEVVRVSLPACQLIPLTPKEELNFEKMILKNQYKVKNRRQDELDLLFNEFCKYSEFVKQPVQLNSLNMEESLKLSEKLETGLKKEDFQELLEAQENEDVSLLS
jgi:hypothetical protein